MTVKSAQLGGTDWADGDKLYAADLLDTIESTMLPISFAHWVQAIIALDYQAWSGFGYSMPQLPNLLVDSLVGSSKIHANSTGDYDPANDIYSVTGYDEFGDASISAVKWSQATTDSGGGDCGSAGATETANNLQVWAQHSNCGGVGGHTVTSTVGSDGTTPKDYKASGNDWKIVTRIYESIDGGAGSMGEIFIGNTVVKTFAASSNDTSVWTLIINYAAQTCDVYNDGVVDTLGVDISGAGANWYLKFKVTDVRNGAGVGSSSSMNMTYVRNVEKGVATFFQSTAKTLSSTIENAVLTVNTNTNTGCTYSVSANNGTNFETTTLNTVHTFTNTGTQLMVKVAYTENTLSVSATLPLVYQHACFGNYL